MRSVGNQIRTARLEAGISLEQVSAKTCIPVKVLQSIEEDDLSPISSAFFYKSFVKQACATVGLPYSELASAVDAACSAYPEPLLPGRGEAVIRSAMVRPVRKPRGFRWLLPAASFAVVLVACTGLYAVWEGHVRLRSETPLVSAARSLPKHASVPRSQPALEPRKETTIPSEPDGRYHVRLSAVERTWLSIRADGKQVYSGILEVDQTKEVEGQQEGQVRTGNAGGVSIVFNGKPIGVAGPHGSVRTVVFTRDNYQVFPAPVHTALNFTPALIGELLLPPVR